MKTKQLCGIPWKVSKPKSRIAPIPWKKDNKVQPIKTSVNIERKHNDLSKGVQAEEAAKEFLLSKGLTLVDQNFKAKCGEIDLIMTDGAIAVIVEVRYRRSASHGGALESIDANKQRKVVNCASLWWQHIGRYRFQHLQFDVIAMEGNNPIKWIRNAFTLKA